MLNVKDQIASIPAYVLKHYGKFVTETELLTLLHFQIVTIPGAKGWEKIALNMGYENTGPLNATINRLIEKGAIKVTKYVVDANPLWQACADIEGTSETVDVKKRSKTKKESPADVAAKSTLDTFWDKTDKSNFFAWVTTVKKLLEKITEDELQNFVNYLDEYNAARQAKFNHEFKSPVTYWDLTKYADQWIAKGKPANYKSPQVKNFSFD